MAASKQISPQQRIVQAWNRLGGSAPGRWLFNRMISAFVPYSGTIKPQVLQLGDGKVRLQIRDHRKVRNHLNSVHAIALANLGELASGLAMMSILPDNLRAIVTHLEIDYLKKARGTLTALGEANIPERIPEDTEIIVHASILDDEEDEVSRIRVHWRVGPQPERAAGASS